MDKRLDLDLDLQEEDTGTVENPTEEITEEVAETPKKNDTIVSSSNATPTYLSEKEKKEEEERKKRVARKKKEQEDAEFEKNYVKQSEAAGNKPNIKKVNVTEKKSLQFLKKKQTWIAVGVVVLVILVGVLKSVLGGGNSKENYFTVLDTILNSDGGQFSYTVTVNSGKHTDKGLDSKGYTADDLNNLEASTESTEAEETNTTPSAEPTDNSSSILESTGDADSEKTLSAKTEDWNKSDSASLTEWQYPNYTVKISGSCTSVEPYTAKINVILATENFSDAFTDITAVEDNYYINVEQMKYWLENSKDSYLVSLAKEMPDGSKYIHVSKDDFKIPSRYAEDGEKDLSGTQGLYAYKKQLLTLINMVTSTVQDYCSFESNSKDGFVVSAQGEAGANVANALKSMVTKSGDFYDAYIGQLELSDDAKKQKDREKDNFISAMSKAMLYMNLETTDAMNFAMSGNALTLRNGDNNQQYEANMNLTYTINDTDYAVSIAAQRVGAQAEEIKAPTDSVSDTLMTLPDILVITNDVTDYFNFTDIDLGKQLEPTPENSINVALQNFVNMVNENNCYDGVLSVHNVMSFLQKYSNIQERDAETDNDKACVILTNDFLDKFSNLLAEASKQIVKDEVTGEETDVNNQDKSEGQDDVEQFPEVTTTIDGVDVTFKVNEKKSTAKLLVVDMIADNKTDKDVTFDTTAFQAKTLLSSVYPSNNKTLLGGFDSAWYDKYSDKVEENKTVKAGETDDTTLYFVISDGNEYMDIWYNDNNLGVIEQY